MSLLFKCIREPKANNAINYNSPNSKKILYLLSEVSEFTTAVQGSPCYERGTNPMPVTVGNLLQRDGQEHTFCFVSEHTNECKY